MRTSSLICFLLVGAAAHLSGQTNGDPSNSGMSNPNMSNPGMSSPNMPTSLSTPGMSNGNPDVGGFPRDNRILMLQGRVILDDGSTPRDPITIERVCGTYVYKEGYANSRGEYSVQLGLNTGIILDASQDGNTLNPASAGQGLTSDISPNAMWDCELRASLTGYHSESIPLANQRNMDNHVINLVLHYMGDVRESNASATSAQAPKEAQKAYDRGVAAVKAGRPDDAQKELLKAVQAYDRYAAAWFELGQVYERRSHVPEAKDAYNHALAADGNYLGPYEKLYQLAFKESSWQQAADLSGKLLALNPYDYGDAYYFNSWANLQLGKLEPAEKSAREAVKVKPPKYDVRSHYALGMILGRKGDYSGAVAELRAFLQGAPNSPDRARIEALIKTAEGSAAQATASIKQ
jgi:tetratricopeptide (TPR) repeat protein